MHGYEHGGHDTGCRCGMHHGYRAMTLEEEVEMLEGAKKALQDQLASIDSRLTKLKA